jgi:SAM-dependent MidA family methyltransferase
MRDIRTIIKEEALQAGVISFARFMELALYCPNLGYYEQVAVSPGRKGDFFTSVSVGALFGQLLAYQCSEWLDQMPGRRRQIVEAGAHDGRLAGDMLGWLQAHRPDISNSLEYWILEPSAIRKKCQQNALGKLAGSVHWFNSWSELPASGVNGVIISNELLDAFPTHRLGWNAAEEKWVEWGVQVKGDELAWAKMPDDSGGGCAFAAEVPPELLAVLPEGFTTEYCPLANEWWGQAAAALESGKLITLDYGLTAEEFFAPERKEGTLRAYFRHHQSGDLLSNAGEQDITANVNFTAIRETGEKAGLTTETFVTQARFVTEIFAKNSREGRLQTQWTSSQVRQFQTLTHPEHLGHSFRVLAQSR